MSWYEDYFLIGFGGIPKTRKKLTQFENRIVSQNVFFRNCETALNRYTIKNLPDTLSERVILQSFFSYGCTCFFELNGSLLALPAAPTGDGLNIYGDPLKAWVFARNGDFNEEITLYIKGGYNDNILTQGSLQTSRKSDPKGVLVWESLTRYPLINSAIFYSERIADTLRTLDINRKWLKRPFIPVGEDSIIPNILAMLKSIEENDEVIPVDTGVMDIDKFNMLPVDIKPESIRQVVSLCEWYENKWRERCGIDNNAQIDKKGENLIQAEVQTNDQYTKLSLDEILPVIEEGLDNTNRMFGTNLKVERKQKKENVPRETSGGRNDELENT